MIYLFLKKIICKKQSISDFARDPRHRAKLNVNQLAKLFECWPNMEYAISHCSTVSYMDFVLYNLVFCFTSKKILCFVTLTSHEYSFLL